MNDGSYAVTEDGDSSMVSTDRSQDPDTLEAAMAPASSIPVNPEPTTVSERLLAARLSLGLSVADVAVRTRVTLRHIEALETGDYSAMPGRPYAIGFAKAYARAVGLPADEIANAVRSELEGTAPRPEPRVLNQFEVGDPAKTPSRLVGWLALLLVGGILAMGGIFWRSYYAPAVSLPSLVRESAQPAADPTLDQTRSPRPATGPQPAISGPVVFTALEPGIWVKFYDGNGKQLLQKQLAKGESYTVPGDALKPQLWTGRPDALSITIGGKAIPRLSDAERIIKDVAVDAASLQARAAAVVPVQGPQAVAASAPR